MDDIAKKENGMLDTSDLQTIDHPARLFPREALIGAYTPNYCEENIYLVLRDYVKQEHLQYYTVVFISNKQKFIPLFYQKLCQSEEVPICWDYHVILLYRPPDPSTNSTGPTCPVYVYDFDTLLVPFPLLFTEYFRKSLYGPYYPWRLPTNISTLFTACPRKFKLVNAQNYIRLFASSRVHMLKTTASSSLPSEEVARAGITAEQIAKMPQEMFMAKPPEYPPIKTKASSNTLPAFLDFPDNWIDGEYGRILDENSFLNEFSFFIE